MEIQFSIQFQFPRKSLPAMGHPVGLAQIVHAIPPPQCRRHHSGHPTPTRRRGESGPSTKPFYLGIGLGDIPFSCGVPESNNGVMKRWFF
nr:hypothetical protein Iba_chr10eCG14670 [Ipomoea batatas]